MAVKFDRIRCMDCGRDTGSRGLGEYPTMLRHDLWLSITAETGGAGVLCRADMERRLGRALTEADMQPWGRSPQPAGRVGS